MPAMGPQAFAVVAEELFSVEKRHERHEQFLAAVAGFENLAGRYGLGDQGNSVPLMKEIQLPLDVVAYRVEGERSRGVVGVMQSVRVMRQVVSLSIADSNPNVTSQICSVSGARHAVGGVVNTLLHRLR